MDYRESHKAPTKGVEYHAKFTANPYRSFMWGKEKEVLDEVVRRFHEPPIEHLDFACGTGRVVEYLQKFASASVGVDVSESMLGVARARLSGVTLLNTDITNDEGALGDRQFDLITAFRFFPNAQDKLRDEAMRSIVARLRRSGTIVFNNHKQYSSLIYRFGRASGRCDLHEMRAEEVDRLLERFGLVCVACYHIGVVPATERYRVAPMWVIRPVERWCSRQEFLRPLASNIIYVCKRT